MNRTTMVCAAGLLALAPAGAGAVTLHDSPGWKLDGSGNWQYDAGRVDIGDGEGADSSGHWRRQRLGLLLERKDAGELALEYDFTSHEWTDAVLRIKGVLGGQLQLGQFKQPLGLEELTSDKRTLFEESSLAGGFALGRRKGMGWLFNPAALGVQVSVFDRNLNGVPSSQGGAGRLWWTPLMQPGKVWHVGVALAQENPDNDRSSLSARPPTRLRDLRVARTGTLDAASSQRRAALELIGVHGSAWLQGEWQRTDVERDSRADFDGQGWYLQAGWLSGGAQRGYKGGVVQAPDRGGVFELGARVSEIDLDDGAVHGGRARSVGAVASWYFKPEVRAMLDFSRTDIRDGGARGDVRVLQLRLQYVF